MTFQREILFSVQNKQDGLRSVEGWGFYPSVNHCMLSVSAQIVRKVAQSGLHVRKLVGVPCLLLT